MMLQSVMKDYLKETTAESPRGDLFGLVVESRSDIPIEVAQSTWSNLQAPERIAKKFEFGDTETRNWFLKELIEDEAQNGHHGKILIDGLGIVIEVYTHDVDAVTELDLEYAKRCDDIYEDVGLLGELGYGYR